MKKLIIIFIFVFHSLSALTMLNNLQQKTSLGSVKSIEVIAPGYKPSEKGKAHTLFSFPTRIMFHLSRPVCVAQGLQTGPERLQLLFSDVSAEPFKNKQIMNTLKKIPFVKDILVKEDVRSHGVVLTLLFNSVFASYDSLVIRCETIKDSLDPLFVVDIYSSKGLKDYSYKNRILHCASAEEITHRQSIRGDFFCNNIC